MTIFYASQENIQWKEKYIKNNQVSISSWVKIEKLHHISGKNVLKAFWINF